MLEGDHTKEWQQELSRDSSEKNIIARRYRDEKPPAMDPATPGQTFIALAHFLEVSARQALPHTTQGRFSDELYCNLLHNVTDLATHRARTNVSAFFREMCQARTVLTDDFEFPPYDGSEISESAVKYTTDPVTGARKRLCIVRRSLLLGEVRGLLCWGARGRGGA